MLAVISDYGSGDSDTITVSYTHLDVYKRQGLDLGEVIDNLKSRH